MESAKLSTPSTQFQKETAFAQTPQFPPSGQQPMPPQAQHFTPQQVSQYQQHVHQQSPMAGRHT